MAFTISTKFTISELADFLGSIWGIQSPLAKVCRLYRGHGQKVNTALYAVIRHHGSIVGSVGIKFINEDHIELGSLAILKRYRGIGLSAQLFSWLDTIVRKYVGLGYSVISYTTLGSTVMSFIIPKVTDITHMSVYPLNIALGVIPISGDKASENINSLEILVNRNGKLYTSTLAILATMQTAIYEKMSLFERYDFQSILPIKCVDRSKVQYIEKDNVVSTTPGTRLVLTIIKSANIEKIPNISAHAYHQISVPMINVFGTIHEHMRERYTVTGFNIIENVLHVVYSNSDINTVNGAIEYLKTLDNDVVNRFADMIYLINRQ